MLYSGIHPTNNRSIKAKDSNVKNQSPMLLLLSALPASLLKASFSSTALLDFLDHCASLPLPLDAQLLAAFFVLLFPIAIFCTAFCCSRRLQTAMALASVSEALSAES